MAEPAKRPANRQTTPSKLPMVLGGLAVVLAAIIIIVLTTSGSGTAVSVEEVAGSPMVTTDPLPPFGGDPANDPAIGQRAPVVEGEGIDGGEVTIGDAGQPQLLVFLASWCPHCQAELPELVDWLGAGNLPDDVELTAVITSLDATRPNWPPSDWLEAEDYTGATIVDDADSTIAQRYGMSGTPFWVAIDGDGEVVARASGQLGMDRVQALADAVAPS